MPPLSAPEAGAQRADDAMLMQQFNMDARTYETVFTAAKAGMAEVDRERVKRIVYEASKVGKSWEGRGYPPPSSACSSSRPCVPPLPSPGLAPLCE